MKLRTFAERIGVRYETAWRWFKAGEIKGRQLDTGTIIIIEYFDEPVEVKVILVVYARVSANENRPNLDTGRTVIRLLCGKGWKVHKVVKEVGSGITGSGNITRKVVPDAFSEVEKVEDGKAVLASLVVPIQCG